MVSTYGEYSMVYGVQCTVHGVQCTVYGIPVVSVMYLLVALLAALAFEYSIKSTV
jgi:hypothetical protein